MRFKRVMSAVVLLVALSFVVVAAPSVVEVADAVNESETVVLLQSFGENTVTIDIGERQSETNVRYAEIDGVQRVIAENNNKCEVPLSDKNTLVEIVEKTDEVTSRVVRTRYFYIDVADKTVRELDLMDSHMQFYDEKALRIVGEKGIRFKAHVATLSKLEKTQFMIEEYGYLIATKDSLGKKELSFDSPRYVKGVGFSREKNINIVYDATNDDFDVFTLVLKNIPFSHYNTEIVCKTYTKLRVCGENFVVYGEQMLASAYDVAAKEFSKNYEDTAIAGMMFEYVSFVNGGSDAFEGVVVTSDVSDGICKVSGSFGNVSSDETKYNVYLATYNKYGTMISVKKSDDFVLEENINEFDVSFALSPDETQVSAVVFTHEMAIVGADNNGNWLITKKNFYDTLSQSSFSADNYFSPDGDVSVLEGVTFVSNVHAKYYNKDVHQASSNYEYT